MLDSDSINQQRSTVLNLKTSLNNTNMKYEENEGERKREIEKRVNCNGSLNAYIFSFGCALVRA